MLQRLRALHINKIPTSSSSSVTDVISKCSVLLSFRKQPKMAPKLYKMDVSPPVRSVYLTAKALGIALDYEETTLGVDNLKPEYVKLNPQHTIPTLEDEGKVIWDSHAINVYLVNKYGRDDSLYPKDLYKRAVVDQRLHFDSGVLFSVLRSIVRQMKYKGLKSVPQDAIDESHQGYEFLEKFLKGQDWVAGDKVTLADFSLIPTVTSLNVLVPLDSAKYPSVAAWIKRAEQLPYYDVNQKGLNDFVLGIKKLMS